MSQEKAAKPQRSLVNTIGAIAFFVGVLLSIVGGIFSQDNGTIILILVILGIIIGLFNISAQEVVTFLVAAIALMVVGNAGFAPLDKVIDGLGKALDGIVGYTGIFVVPAAIIQAVRVVVATGPAGIRVARTRFSAQARQPHRQKG